MCNTLGEIFAGEGDTEFPSPYSQWFNTDLDLLCLVTLISLNFASTVTPATIFT